MTPLCLAEQRKKDFCSLLGVGHHLLGEKYRSLLLLGIMLILSSRALPQVETATVSGVVTDQSGGVIAGAEVQVTNADTNITSTSSSNSSGVYLVTGLKPGRYRIHVAKDGFKGIDLTDLTLNVQDSVSRNFSLQIGSTAESVTVDGSTPSINTESAAVSTVIDRNFAGNLPLNGRSFNTLLQLTPGVVIAPTNGYATGQFSMAGQRTDANNFTVDGVSANFGVVEGAGAGPSGTGTGQAVSAIGGTSSLVSVEALQEFRIETSSFSPEFGRQPGGQVILSTRSGTNDFHGGIYEYFRNDVMDANDWFANQAGNPRVPERHNDFGGFFGGPIWRDKTFFFLSYEGARLRLPQTKLITVPSLCARAGGSTCTIQSASAAIAPYLNAYPLPNGPVSTDGYTASFTGSFSNKGTLDAGSIRIDHTFNSQFSVFGRYNEAPSEIVERFNSLSTLRSTEVNTRTVTVGLNASLNSRMFNSFRANYSTQYSSGVFSLDSFGGAVPTPSSLLLTSLSKDVNQAFLRIGGYDGSTVEIGPDSKNKTVQGNLVDDFSLSVGRHQMKFGADYRNIHLGEKPALNLVQYTSQSVQDFSSPNAQVSLTIFSTPPSRIRSQSSSLYAQDTWKVSPRLTFTYGIRWELAPAPDGLGSTTLASWTNTSTPSQIGLAPAGTPLWRTTYGNFAPRIGAAYALSESGDFVLRVGGGIFYDLGVGSVASLGIYFPNGGASFAQMPLPISDLTPLLPPLVSTQAPYFFTLGFASDLKLPRSYQWNIALEKSFKGKQVISVTYVGQAGRDLLRQESLFQPNANFIDDFLLNVNDAVSNYHALQVQYRRPLSGGLQALLNYTFSHSLDSASDDVTSGLPSNVISNANDYASSAFDVRQTFSGALTYAVPSMARGGPLALLAKGWSLDTVIVARSGFPFNATIFNVPVDPGSNANTRPDLVPGQPLWISNPNAPGGKSLNPSAFTTPSTVRQGTEGRNDIPGFGLTQVDLSLGRKFALNERMSLQFRSDAFNLFNHPNFANPSALPTTDPLSLQSESMLNAGLRGLNPLFQQGGPRSLQLSLKLTF